MDPEGPSYIPGQPASPEPPSRLVEIAERLHHPDVTRVGLTTTAEGEWALMVRVRPGTPTPVQEIEATCRDYPIVYQQEEPPGWTIARPAYPALGE